MVHICLFRKLGCFTEALVKLVEGFAQNTYGVWVKIKPDGSIKLNGDVNMALCSLGEVSKEWVGEDDGGKRLHQ